MTAAGGAERGFFARAGIPGLGAPASGAGTARWLSPFGAAAPSPVAAGGLREQLAAAPLPAVPPATDAAADAWSVAEWERIAPRAIVPPAVPAAPADATRVTGIVDDPHTDAPPTTASAARAPRSVHLVDIDWTELPPSHAPQGREDASPAASASPPSAPGATRVVPSIASVASRDTTPQAAAHAPPPDVPARTAPIPHAQAGAAARLEAAVPSDTSSSRDATTPAAPEAPVRAAAARATAAVSRLAAPAGPVHASRATPTAAPSTPRTPAVAGADANADDAPARIDRLVEGARPWWRASTTAVPAARPPGAARTGATRATSSAMPTSLTAVPTRRGPGRDVRIGTIQVVVSLPPSAARAAAAPATVASAAAPPPERPFVSAWRAADVLFD